MWTRMLGPNAYAMPARRTSHRPLLPNRITLRVVFVLVEVRVPDAASDAAAFPAGFPN